MLYIGYVFIKRMQLKTELNCGNICYQRILDISTIFPLLTPTIIIILLLFVPLEIGQFGILGNGFLEDSKG